MGGEKGYDIGVCGGPLDLDDVCEDGVAFDGGGVDGDEVGVSGDGAAGEGAGGVDAAEGGAEEGGAEVVVGEGGVSGEVVEALPIYILISSLDGWGG